MRYGLDIGGTGESLLERAARAVIEAEQDQWDLPAAEWDMKALEVHGALSIARAVLMAVREPDRDVRMVGRDRVLNNNLSPYADYSVAIGMGFTAMIDAILNETPK